MSMPAFARRVMELEKKVEIFEAYRYLRIGGIVDVTAPDLPLENCMWADGSLALFDLWPELKAKYENGGFSGLLLPCDCSDEDKTTYPLKWVPDSPNPTGLFVPRLIGLFARYCAGAGAYQADAVQTGITRLVIGAWSPDGTVSIILPIGNLTASAESTTTGAVSSTAPLRYLVDIKQRTADKTRPENVALPIALYLGSPAQV